jgi:LuxR family maltose regulon positive regulatory protein
VADTTPTINSSGNVISGSLLSTKLFIPQAGQLHDILPRPRLLERLTTGLSGKLTLISAPAGFGKTTLLADWIPHCQRRVSWISLDQADNELSRFLTYFIAALQQHNADFGHTLLAALQSSQPPVLESLISALVNEILHSLDACALVLEDYHVIQLQAIHSAVTLLLNNLPPNMHLIITSRADPPLPLARLRVRGHINELRAADLRFTFDEATAFFHKTSDLPLPAEQIKQLETRTEGWGAGLHLAALSLQGLDPSEIAQFIHGFTGNHHYVFEYLAEEVLQQQPEHIQRFLLHSALLSRICGPLCDAILESGDQGSGVGSMKPIPDAYSQTILEYLDRANLFLVPLDNRRHWYRYHHLFADFLRDRLTREIGIERVNELYRRARRWHEQHNLVEEAINYALAGRDWGAATKLTEQVITSLWSSSRHILKWIEALPAEEVHQSPDLCIWYAYWLRLSGEFGPVEKLLDTAERLVRSSGELSKLADVYRNRAITSALRDDARLTIEYAQQALTYYGDKGRIGYPLVNEILARGYFMKGEVDEAERLWTKTIELAKAADSQRTLLFVSAGQGGVWRVRGKLRQAALLEQDLLRQIGERPVDIVKIRALGHLASLYYEWNQLEQAEQYAEQARELAVQTRREMFARSAYLTLAQIYSARGEADRATQTIEQAKEFARRMGGEQPTIEVAASQVRLWLAQDAQATGSAQSASTDPRTASARQSLASAINWAEAQYLDLEGELPYEHQITHLALCRVWIAQRRPDQALRLLERLLSAAEAAGRVGEMVELLALKALAHQAHYQPDQVLATLLQALKLGEPERYVRTFVDEGLPMAELLAQCIAFRQAQEPRRSQDDPIGVYIERLLSAFPIQQDSARLQVLEAPPVLRAALERSIALVEPLSKRELEVLQLLAQGLTNAEIAQQMFLSVLTVKVHIRNIYGKLGVDNRLRAVAKAKDLGLLD